MRGIVQRLATAVIVSFLRLRSARVRVTPSRPLHSASPRNGFTRDVDSRFPAGDLGRCAVRRGGSPVARVARLESGVAEHLVPACAGGAGVAPGAALATSRGSRA